MLTYDRSLPILQASLFLFFLHLLRLSVWGLLAHDDSLQPDSRRINNKRRRMPKTREKRESRQTIIKTPIPSGPAILS